MKILVIDDEPVVLACCQRILENERHEVQTGNSVEEGLRMLQSASFDCLITDIMMPENDGITMIQQIKKLYPSLFILLMTGYATPETLRRGIESGADHCIAKPFTPQELITAIETQNRH